MDISDHTAASMIWEERLRQMREEGYSMAHDDGHTEGQLALLAAAYALSSRNSVCFQIFDILGISWEFKTKDPIRDLVRAGALILAELERRLRSGGL